MTTLPDWLTPYVLTTVLPTIGRVLVIVVAAWVAIRVIRRLVGGLRTHSLHVMRRRAGGPIGELEKRANTLAAILQTTGVGLLTGVAVVMVLRQIGLDITPILAGAGVAGLAVGFGAQNLVRDVIAGFFMLVENQVRVNDVVEINGTGGLVEEMNLRTTVLRSFDGAVHVFQNGAIATLTNLTREFSYYVFDIGVSYGADTDLVMQIMRDVAADLQRDPAFADLILEPLDVQGVDRFADSAVIIKARIKTRPIRQWMVGRELNRRFKQAFDAKGIEIPFPQRTVHLAGLAARAAAPAGAVSADEIRRIVREVLDEEHPGPATD